MEEKRKSQRLKEFNAISTTILSESVKLAPEKYCYNYSEDLSVSGTRIRGNLPLPVDTLLKIDLTLKNLNQKITTFGKVKWIKNIIDNKYCEAGVEFVNTSGDALKKIEDHIFWKQKCTSMNPFGLPVKGYEH